MRSLWKRSKRALRRITATGLNAVVAATPAPIRHRLRPTALRINMLLGDHLFIRFVYPNLHQLSPVAWRSAQPLPHQIRALARRGIRTIVNLRGEVHIPTYELEVEACAKAGVKLIDYRIRSRDAPEREALQGLQDLFQNIEYPVLFHCKSGADRAGLMSALFLHLHHGVPIPEAKKQLSLKFGHIRQADTGVLDYFLERYLEEGASTGMTLLEWVDKKYDPDELRATFRANGWANRIVNDLLKRE